MPRCRHCDAELPDGCPVAVTGCRSYASRKAKQKGDMLTGDEAEILDMLAALCAADVATQSERDLLPGLK